MYTTWKKIWGYIGIILTVCLSVCPFVLICPSFCAIVSNRYLSYEDTLEDFTSHKECT